MRVLMDGEEISFSAIKRKMKIGGKIEFILLRMYI